MISKVSLNRFWQNVYLSNDHYYVNKRGSQQQPPQQMCWGAVIITFGSLIPLRCLALVYSSKRKSEGVCEFVSGSLLLCSKNTQGTRWAAVHGALHVLPVTYAERGRLLACCWFCWWKLPDSFHYVRKCKRVPQWPLGKRISCFILVDVVRICITQYLSEPILSQGT